jgi:type II secretory pathway pseudopilin PulG
LQSASLGRGAFSLIEMLTVVGIIVAMMMLAGPAFQAMKRSGDVTQGAYSISGTLEQARAYATANNTYAWVGFFEEDISAPEGTAGVGRIILSVVASKDGTRVYSEGNVDPVAPADFPPGRLLQIGTLVKLEHTHLETLGAGDVTRPSVPASGYQVAAADFAKRDSTTNRATFGYPLGGTGIYTFSKIIQFSPQGDATKVVDTLTPWMEIGLRPTHGTVIDTYTTNVVAIQVSGIAGQVQVYRR